MSLRRKTPVDMAGVKRSRACSLGKVTAAASKVNSIKHDDPAEIRLIATTELDRILASLQRTEAGFEQSFDDATEFAPTGEDEEETFYEEEEAARTLFEEAINPVKDQAKFLIDLRKAWSRVVYLSEDVKAMETNLDNGENCTSFKPLMETSIEKLREDCDNLSLSDHHSVTGELKACALKLGTLRLQAAAAAPTAVSSSLPAAAPYYKPDFGGAKLPPITLPTFTGNIMEWSNFWLKFTDVVDSKDHLSTTTKLTYLKQAIKDPAVQVILNSPTEGSDTYRNLVKMLHQRYERTKKIHRDLVGKMDNLPEAKNTSQDLRRLVDDSTAYMASIRQTGHYSLETFITSMIYSRLPYKVKLDWDEHHSEEKVVAPFQKLLDFVSNRAYSLADNQQTPKSEVQDKRPQKAAEEKNNQPKRANVHVTTAPISYKYECSLCIPERHPLYHCPKWLKMTIQQRWDQVKARKLCSNCLAPGHTTDVCRSRYRCGECQQQHSSTLHQQTAPSVTVLTPELEAATMMTAQVLLSGPRGERIKARALIDSGAAISLITSKVAQQINLPLAKTELHFSGVSGNPCKPARHCTELAISTLQGTRTLLLKAAVVPVVTAPIPAQEIAPVDDLPHLAGLPLADPTFHIPGQIDILLGADVFVNILTKQMVTGNAGEPAGIETIFGWAIVGAVRPLEKYQSPVQVGVALLQPEDKTLTKHFKHYWMSEQPEEPIRTISSIEQEVQQLYTKDTTYDPEKRIYTVDLPQDINQSLCSQKLCYRTTRRDSALQPGSRHISHQVLSTRTPQQSTTTATTTTSSSQQRLNSSLSTKSSASEATLQPAEATAALSKFHSDLKEVQATFDSSSITKRTSDIKKLANTFSTLKKRWPTTQDPLLTNPPQTEFESCQRALGTLRYNIHQPTLSTIIFSKKKSDATTQDETSHHKPQERQLDSVATPNLFQSRLDPHLLTPSLHNNLASESEAQRALLPTKTQNQSHGSDSTFQLTSLLPSQDSGTQQMYPEEEATSSLKNCEQPQLTSSLCSPAKDEDTLTTLIYLHSTSNNNPSNDSVLKTESQQPPQGKLLTLQADLLSIKSQPASRNDILEQDPAALQPTITTTSTRHILGEIIRPQNPSAECQMPQQISLPPTATRSLPPAINPIHISSKVILPQNPSAECQTPQQIRLPQATAAFQQNINREHFGETASSILQFNQLNLHQAPPLLEKLETVKPTRLPFNKQPHPICNCSSTNNLLLIHSVNSNPATLHYWIDASIHFSLSTSNQTICRFSIWNNSRLCSKTSTVKNISYAYHLPFIKLFILLLLIMSRRPEVMDHFHNLGKYFTCHWPLAKIIETYPGTDGLVRVDLVKTSTSTYKRPVTKLALLHREEKLIAPPGALPPGACLDTEDT